MTLNGSHILLGRKATKKLGFSLCQNKIGLRFMQNNKIKTLLVSIIKAVMIRIMIIKVIILMVLEKK